MYVCMYVGFKTLFYVVRHLDSTASYLPTGLHLGFFRSWPSFYLPPSFSGSRIRCVLKKTELASLNSVLNNITFGFPVLRISKHSCSSFVNLCVRVFPTKHKETKILSCALLITCASLSITI